MTVSEALLADITEVSWTERLQTVAMTVGIMAFGVALGVKWAASVSVNTLGGVSAVMPADSPQLVILSVATRQMKIALAVAAVALILGAALAGRDFTSGGESS